MAMNVSKDCSFAISVSADHTVARYDLRVDSRPSGYAVNLILL